MQRTGVSLIAMLTRRGERNGTSDVRSKAAIGTIMYIQYFWINLSGTRAEERRRCQQMRQSRG